MRTDEHALATLDANLRIPHRNFRGKIAFLPTRGVRWERAIARHRAHGQSVATACRNRPQHIAHKGRRLCRHRRTNRDPALDVVGHFHFKQIREGRVHRRDVHLHDLFALLAVGFLDGILDRHDGFFTWQHARNGKEARLHHGVNARPHARRPRHRQRINREHLCFRRDEIALRFRREIVPDYLRPMRRVQQQRPARHETLRHVHALEEDGLMTRHEVRRRDEIRGTNRLRPEAQMRNRDSSGFLRVIDEVTLRIIVRVLADDLDGFLVRADRAVRAEPVEQRPHHFRRLDRKLRVHVKARVANVVHDPDREMIFRFRDGEIVEHRLDHRGGEFLRR